MVTVKWCISQKRGLELIEPNDNLCKGYFLKEKDVLEIRAVFKKICE